LLLMGETNDRTTSITGDLTQAFPGTYDFTVGLTLRGTMRIDRRFRIIVNSPPGIIWGDVDGDGVVTLADLILLAQHLEDPRIPINEPAADLNQDGSITTADLRILRRFFAQPGQTVVP